MGYKLVETPTELLPIIRGMLLGDASLALKVHSYRLTFGHGPKQEAYIRHKRERLASIATADIYQSSNGRCYFSTRCSPQLTELHSQFYVEGRKRVTLEILDGLTPEGIAYWYMDDGNRSKIHKQLKFCTHGYTKEENELIQSWFYYRHGIWLRLYQDKEATERQRAKGIRQRTDNRGWFLTALLPEVAKLEHLIRPYIIPEMLYKLNPEGLSDSPNFAATRRGRREDAPPVPPEELVNK